MLPPHELKNKTFSRAVRGYNTVEVDEYVGFLIEKYTELYRENDELERKLKSAVTRLEKIKSDEDTIRSTLIDAKHSAAQIRENAENQAEALVHSAKVGCDTVLANFDEKITAGYETIGEMKREVIALKQELFARYSEHIHYLEKLTDGLDLDNIPTPDEARREVFAAMKKEIAAASHRSETTASSDASRSAEGHADSEDSSGDDAEPPRSNVSFSKPPRYRQNTTREASPSKPVTVPKADNHENDWSEAAADGFPSEDTVDYFADVSPQSADTVTNVSSDGGGIPPDSGVVYNDSGVASDDGAFNEYPDEIGTPDDFVPYEPNQSQSKPADKEKSNPSVVYETKSSVGQESNPSAEYKPKSSAGQESNPSAEYKPKSSVGQESNPSAEYKPKSSAGQDDTVTDNLGDAADKAAGLNELYQEALNAALMKTPEDSAEIAVKQEYRDAANAERPVAEESPFDEPDSPQKDNDADRLSVHRSRVGSQSAGLRSSIMELNREYKASESPGEDYINTPDSDIDDTGYLDFVRAVTGKDTDELTEDPQKTADFDMLFNNDRQKKKKPPKKKR